MPFERLPDTTADELEREVLAAWATEGLFRQTMARNQGGQPFVFYEGPPTANGKPGIHHVFARTIKDLICRHRAMHGHAVTRIAGWDTHGLPVEIEVEKALKLSGKTDIETFGVAEFNARCRESVFRYKSDWESLSNRIGYWLDYEQPYVTYTNNYIETVWWLLSELWKKDLLYEGHKVLPYCIRCGTSLSSHELALGYDTHRSPSIHVLFRVRDTDASAATHLLVWTTTPWTLPSNVAVAINPDFTYVELDVDGTKLIVEKSIAQTKVVPGGTGGEPLASYPLLREISGSDMIGWRYHQLIDAVDVQGDEGFRIVAGSFVTDEEGTGLVHIAPAFGADDYATVQAEGLPFVNPVDASGRFTQTGWDDINGLTVFEANPNIASRLHDEGKLLGRYEPTGYEHSYPFCWRCDAPLIYYAKRSWFVRTTAFKDEMSRVNANVNWTPPEVGAGRFGEWLENNVDWALSRDRYWGTPLPAWVCTAECGGRQVIGSFQELAERSGRSLDKDFDPHKPFIDEIELPCETCGQMMRRVPEVIDAWFDSGAMPFAQWHYPFENTEAFEHHFPADYICEGLDQTRGWFYSLLAIAMGVRGSPAYRNVIVNGLVLDADGRKMSKRIGNVVDPWNAVERFGADAVRIYLTSSGQVWLPKRFDLEGIPDQAFGFLTRLKNSFNFFAQYAEGWLPTDTTDENSTVLIDRWLASRLDEVVVRVDEAWRNYDVRTGVRSIMEFCDNDLSNWYIRLNRARFWAPDSSADPVALGTLYHTLVMVSRLLAPVAPFVSDAIHRRLTGVSVHLSDFPRSNAGGDADLNDAMAAVRKLASLARHAREEATLRVRQPLQEMRVAVPPGARTPAFDTCLDLLAREVNVKVVTLVETDEDLVRLVGKPNFRSLGKVYGKETPRAANGCEQLGQDALRRLEGGESVELVVDDVRYVYRPEDVVVERVVSTDWVVKSEGPLVVALNPTLTDDLRKEGLAREAVHRVQRLRKDAGFEYNTRIRLGIVGPEPVQAAVEFSLDFVARETLAREVVLDRLEAADVEQAVAIDEHDVVLTLQRF